MRVIVGKPYSALTVGILAYDMNITAIAGGAGNATELVAQVNRVTTLSPGGAVRLKDIGLPQTVFNRSGSPLLLLPSVGTGIEANGIDQGITLSDGGSATFTYDGAGVWVEGSI